LQIELTGATGAVIDVMSTHVVISSNNWVLNYRRLWQWKYMRRAGVLHLHAWSDM